VDHTAQALAASAAGGVLIQGAAESYAGNVLAEVEADADGWAAELATWQRRAAARGASLTTPGAPPGLGLPWLTIALVGVAVVGVGVGAWYWYGPKARRPIRRNPKKRGLLDRYGQAYEVGGFLVDDLGNRCVVLSGPGPGGLRPEDSATARATSLLLALAHVPQRQGTSFECANCELSAFVNGEREAWRLAASQRLPSGKWRENDRSRCPGARA
jgi:hypothetical protein